MQLSQNLSKREEEEEEKLVSREYKRRHVFWRSEDANAEKTDWGERFVGRDCE